VLLSTLISIKDFELIINFGYVCVYPKTGFHLGEETHLLASEGTSFKSENLAAAALLASDLPLTVDELFSFSTPDQKMLHEYAFNKFKSLMLYTVDDDRRKLFGQDKPSDADLGASVVALSSDPSVKTLVDGFSKAYLSKAYSESSNDVIKAIFTDHFGKSSRFKEKLTYYFSGSKGAKCMSKSDAYNRSMQKINDASYPDFVAGLDRYINDPQKRNWGKELYDKCMNEKTLNGLYMLSGSEDGKDRVVHICNMLHALDPFARVKITNEMGEEREASYSEALYTKVIIKRLDYMVQRFAGSDKESVNEYLIEFYKAYFKSFVEGGKWKEDIRKEANEEIQKLYEEYQVNDVDALVAKLGDLFASIATLLINEGAYKPFALKFAEFAHNNPRWGKFIKGSIIMAGYGFAIFTVYSAFGKWKDLRVDEKIEAIVNLTTIISEGVSQGLGWYVSKIESALREAEIKDIMLILDDGVAGIIANGGELPLIGDQAGIGGVAEIGEREAIQLRIETLEARMIKMQKFAKIAKGFARAMTIVALAAATVVLGFQTANDFATGQPPAVKVFDILEIVATGSAFIVEAGIGIAAIAGSTVASWIPVVGAVLCIAAIVFSFVSLFLDRKPPETPAEKFIKDTCIPFIQGLDEPDLEWIKSNRQTSAHISGKSIELERELQTYDVLYPKDAVFSTNKKYKLIYQEDRNLVVYEVANNHAISSSNTWDPNVESQGKDKGYVIMQADGNLVIYVKENGQDQALWASNTWGNPGAYLIVEDDGTAAIYKKDSTDRLWHLG
jgi:hypothetical protein